MITKSVPQCRYVCGRTPEESAAMFNQAMIELARMNPHYERDGIGFWIFWTTRIDEPENIVDQHELNGEHYYCRDCNHCIRDLNRYGEIDMRKKHATCGLTGDRCHIDSSVCELFYNR